MKRLFIFLFLFTASVVSAHPMGNFSINHYAAISTTEKGIALDYIIDLAEIPTFQEMQNLDRDQDRTIGDAEGQRYADAKGKEFANHLTIRVNDKRLALERLHSKLTVVPGAGGLPTLVIRSQYFAKWNDGLMPEQNKIAYYDQNYPDRIGWKEIVVRPAKTPPVSLDLSRYLDRSKELTQYPEDATISPPQETEVNFQFRLPLAVRKMATTKTKAMVTEIPAQKELAPKTSRIVASSEDNSAAKLVTKPSAAAPASKREDRFTRLISAKQLNNEVIFFSLLIAFALGSMHALSPGHGKAIVAGYLVGSRGTAKHALFLGGVVTLTHTIGVFALGFITLFGSRYILPEDLYPWLGFLSGLSIVIIGISLFRKRFYAMREKQKREQFHTHAQIHSHTHHDHSGTNHSHHHPNHDHHHDPHHGHSHSHHHDAQDGHSHHHGHSHLPVDAQSGTITWRSLLTVGISGGALPCPSALVVLLSAISLQRIGFGLLLIVAFSLGLAVVLTSIGVLFVYASNWTRKFHFGGNLIYRMPLVSSLVISVLGFAIAIKSLMQV